MQIYAVRVMLPRVTAVSASAKSKCTKRRFRALPVIAKYDFLLVFRSDLRYRWIRCQVVSREIQRGP